MTEKNTILSGQKIDEICKMLVPDQDDYTLLQKLQTELPEHTVRLAKSDDEWYRVGGIVNRNGDRIAQDLIEWVERTFIECGHDFQVLIDHALDQQLIATRQTGKTLYFVVETGHQAEDFLLLEIDKSHEVSDRLLINEAALPEDQEDIIDPLIPSKVESFNFGHSYYQYRRKTDVRLFLKSLNEHYKEEHSVKRFLDDWNRSSARETVFSREWIVRPYQHIGRYGEQIINAEIINVHQQQLPHLDDMTPKHGESLQRLLGRFDRQAGYPFAWFFFMLKGRLVSPHNGENVYKDLNGDFSYLPKRDEAILRDWVASPYNI